MLGVPYWEVHGGLYTKREEAPGGGKREKKRSAAAKGHAAAMPNVRNAGSSHSGGSIVSHKAYRLSGWARVYDGAETKRPCGQLWSANALSGGCAKGAKTLGGLSGSPAPPVVVQDHRSCRPAGRRGGACRALRCATARGRACH